MHEHTYLIKIACREPEHLPPDFHDRLADAVSDLCKSLPDVDEGQRTAVAWNETHDTHTGTRIHNS